MLAASGRMARFDPQGEIRLLQRLSHPNIVRYIDSYQSDNQLHIVLE